MYLVPYLIILIIATFCSWYFNKHLLQTIPIAIMFMTSVTYLCGFFGNLRYGISLIIVFSVLFVIYAVICCIKKNIRLELLCDYNYIYGIIIFTILYIAIYVYNMEASFSYPDEWSHWGPFIKDMYLRNQFYNTLGHVATTHIAYPPFTSLFEYVYIKLVNDFSMQNMYRAYHLMCYSLILPVMSNIKCGKNILEGVKSVVLSMLIILYFIFINRFFEVAVNPIKSILPDGYIGLCFGMCVYTELNFNPDDLYDYMFVALGGISILLSKQIGILFFLISTFIFIINNIKKMNNTNIMKYIIVIIIPIVFLICWKVLVKFNGITDQFDLQGKVSARNIVDILLFNGGEAYQQQVLVNYKNWIFNVKIFGINQIGWITLYVIFLFFTSVITKKKYNKEVFCASFLLIIGLMCYKFVLLCLYFSNFSVKEALELAQVWRYVSTYYLGMIFFASCVLIDYFLKMHRTIQLFIGLTLMVSLLIASTLLSKRLNYLPKRKDELNVEAFKKFDSLQIR